MAQKVAAATGAWSAAATWNSVTNTPTLHASTNITLNSTTGIFTAGFTAPDLVSACTGVLLFVTTKPVGATYVVTLQESTVDTAATVSIVDTAFPIASNWIYFKFPTPYVFTTLTASAYRFKITRASATTNAIVAADSGGTLPAYLATDDRTGVPGTTDDLWIVTANGSGTITVTMDGTQTIGNGGNTTGFSQRTITNAITISQGGLLTFDTAATCQLTCKGNITTGGGGELRIGTVATPYPAAQTATLIFNENGTSCNYGLESYISGKLTLQGAPQSSTTLWKTTFTSGLGTAASPLIVADAVDWSVGDEILVCASSNSATNYNETENKFIITKNSATSYVLSNTSGGVEAALSFTHTGAYVLNVQRNIIIKTTVAAERFYLTNNNTMAGEVDIDWVRFQEVGSNNGSKFGIAIVQTSLTATGACDYSVAYGCGRHGFFCNTSGIALTFTGLIACNSTVSGSGQGVIATLSGANNKTFVDCFVVKNSRQGFQIQSVSNFLTRCVGISNNTGGGGGSLGGFLLINAIKITMINCESHCNQTQGMAIEGATTAIEVNGYLSGTKGINGTIDILTRADTFADVTFINSYFSSATLVSGYLTMIAGSEIRFQKNNNTDNNHLWYTNTGIARNSGAGLVDTTTKTVGNFALRLAPENLTTGLFWESLIGISANSAASVFGFIQKNVAFGTDVVTVELFLPGSTVADASQTMGNTTGTWLVFSMAAAYTGSVAAFARVRITAKTITAAAYCYVADLYNGTNVLTSFKAWNDGKPSPVFTDLLGDPASVWAILESTQTTVGTMGYEISTDLATLRADVDDLQTRVPAALTAGGNIKADTLMIEGVDATDQINAQVVDALNVDTYAEPGSVPAATASLVAKIGWLMALARNKILQTATLQTLRNDGDSGNVGSSVVSDDNVTATRGKWS